MRHLVFSATTKQHYPICILVPTIRRQDIEDAYLAPFPQLNRDDVIVIDLHQGPGKKTPMSEMKAYITDELAPVLTDLGVKHILVADGEYFKALTKSTKIEVHLGYLLDCAHGPWKVSFVPNHKAIFFDPEKTKAKIAQGITAVVQDRLGNYQTPGASIIHSATYPIDPQEIEDWLERLIVENRPLTADIETFSLKHHTAGIGTISFAWNQHEGIAFPVDLGPDPARVRRALKSFFERFFQKLIWHGASFDAYVLIYQLWMRDILDTKGLLAGLRIMMRNWDCTKTITYLATNSCAGNVLKLKLIAQEFAGNWAQDDIIDITKIPLPQLLQYNLVDSLSTWYTHNKHYSTMVLDQQEQLYFELFKPATIDIIQMQLTGMPVNMVRAIEVNDQLAAEEAVILKTIMASPIIQQYNYRLEEQHMRKRNAKLKTKVIVLGDEPQIFNPNSDPQMRDLLFTYLNLPVIGLTASKMPSTDGEAIEALLNRVTDPDQKALLEAFQMYAILATLTTNFMPAILDAAEGPDGWHYLFGNFNLGGTLSGRLSSSKPNLQNLPSTGKGHKIKLVYAKMIKSCFQAPPGWLFMGIDFSSLEDRISALTTKDPNKLKVYTDGYDGHSLRAFAYWPDKMPDIVDTVESINTIQKKYKPLRDRSKNPTFTLTYQGTKFALMKKYGFTEAEAEEVVSRYNELYHVSIQWVNARLAQASRYGYITAAFGLRVRTPLLKQVILKTGKTPFEAEAEGRSAGNALGQSWCLLNSRAGVEFNAKVRESKFALDIRPCSQIHDAQYHLVRDSIDAVMFVNEHLVEATFWQDHPEIAHDEVGLGGEIGIFYPDWSNEITIPNGATEDEIFKIISSHIK